MTVSGILNCNCCNTVVCETNFLSPISQNGMLYGSQIDLSITFEPVGRFAYFWYHLKGKWMLFTSVQKSKFPEKYQCDSFWWVGSHIVATMAWIIPVGCELYSAVCWTSPAVLGVSFLHKVHLSPVKKLSLGIICHQNILQASSTCRSRTRQSPESSLDPSRRSWRSVATRTTTQRVKCECPWRPWRDCS